MKSTEIVGFKRANLGKKEARELRLQAMVPCVLYGGTEQVHFAAPMYLFRELLFSPNVYKVTLNIEGEIHYGILQDVQYHPVSDIILHADFLAIDDEKEIKIEVPVRFTGTAIGVTKGGKLVQKLRKIKVIGLAKNIPDFVDVPVGDLDLGKSVKVGHLKVEGFKIVNNASLPIAGVEIPRALRGTLK
ncbi:50S ribosomal protein L25/general stress protein Ctc [Runella sp. CRIBMP]|uniref:50S ribosomal protein L25/general stress protein Ctc n=1 Tax=Runella sp. CRIBMP TaxID=2683261 RepID=UPI001412ED58|nr:50S ribosomal protein L25/general stress protein Ctc [Runella sp. CRIBMP]NBB20642.1 50S ribosomal protein L25/general stress protein Ctc [Runella sp. CRIBMP]